MFGPPHMFGPPGQGDGSLTLPCLVEALEGVPGGRAPGSDGMTYEGLTCLLLVESCNEAFASIAEEGLMLTRSQRSGRGHSAHSQGWGLKLLDEIAFHRPITLFNCDY
jgi:hypothetical protein